MHGYIVDQGSFNSICSYGYGNKRYEHSKPLQGILRHDSVLRVGRRAFFNRYGLVGTYFPKNATEFTVESLQILHLMMCYYFLRISKRLAQEHLWEYKHWFFGHYHFDRKIGDKKTCLYQEIVELQ